MKKIKDEGGCKDNPDIATLHNLAIRDCSFAVSRYGDGEMSIINDVPCARGNGISGSARKEKHGNFNFKGSSESTVDQKFRENLVQALHYNGGKYYFVGVHDQGKFKKVHLNITQEIHDKIRGTIIDANVFARSNWPERTNRLWKLLADRRPIWLVCHESADTTSLTFPVERIILVTDTAWRNEGTSERLVKELSDVDPVAVLVAAGPYAPVLVKNIWDKCNRRHTVIDIGSSLDTSFFGEPTRNYHKRLAKW